MRKRPCLPNSNREGVGQADLAVQEGLVAPAARLPAAPARMGLLVARRKARKVGPADLQAECAADLVLHPNP